MNTKTDSGWRFGIWAHRDAKGALPGAWVRSTDGKLLRYDNLTDAQIGLLVLGYADDTSSTASRTAYLKKPTAYVAHIAPEAR